MSAWRDRVRTIRLFPGALLAASLGLAACTGMRPAPSPEVLAAWNLHRQSLADVDAFVIQGRFAVGGVFGTKGQVHWTQNGDSYRVRLWGPFGAGAVLISGDGKRARIRTAEESFETADAESALRERFGWTLPVSGLRWWILGLPAPVGGAGMQFDERGRLQVLEQRGWKLEYPEYVAVGNRTLPRRMDMENDEVSAKLIVDTWTLP